MQNSTGSLFSPVFGLWMANFNPIHTYLCFPLYASLEFQIFYKSWSIIYIILYFQVSIWEIFYRSVEIFTREKTLDLSMSIRHKTRIVAVVGGHGFLDFQDLTSFVECECLTGPPKLSRKRVKLNKFFSTKWTKITIGNCCKPP